MNSYDRLWLLDDLICVTGDAIIETEMLKSYVFHDIQPLQKGI